jgi:hypothetical protein
MTKEAAEAFLNSSGAKKPLGGQKSCIEPAMTSREAAQIRAEFNERVRVAYEAA